MMTSDRSAVRPSGRIDRPPPAWSRKPPRTNRAGSEKIGVEILKQRRLATRSTRATPPTRRMGRLSEPMSCGCRRISVRDRVWDAKTQKLYSAQCQRASLIASTHCSLAEAGTEPEIFRRPGLFRVRFRAPVDGWGISFDRSSVRTMMSWSSC